MNILLINTNPVVSRLITLCIRDSNIVFEEETDVHMVMLDRYDVVFVDEASFSDGLKKVLNNFMIRKKVLLSSKGSNESDLDYFDEVIKKPFLPSQITAVLENFDKDENGIDEIVEDHFIFPLAVESKKSEDAIEEEQAKQEKKLEKRETKVLNSSEIERIKILLEDEEEGETLKVEDDTNYETRKVEVITQHLEADGLEIVREDEYVEILSKKEKKKKSKKKLAKKEKKKKEKNINFEEALVSAVKDMKIKKIKKLLKGANITITINFKDNK